MAIISHFKIRKDKHCIWLGEFPAEFDDLKVRRNDTGWPTIKKIEENKEEITRILMKYNKKDIVEGFIKMLENAKQIND